MTQLLPTKNGILDVNAGLLEQLRKQTWLNSHQSDTIVTPSSLPKAQFGVDSA